MWSEKSKSMKYFSLLLFTLTLLFCSCNKNEPDLEINLPIALSYMPATIEINQDELSEDQKKDIVNLTNQSHVVNDISELPKDPIGRNDVFQYINFKENTLLIAYRLHSWDIDSYSNRFYKNTQENSFNWVVQLGAYRDLENIPDNTQLTRFAILVKKLPENAEFKTWYSLTVIGGY